MGQGRKRLRPPGRHAHPVADDAGGEISEGRFPVSGFRFPVSGFRKSVPYPWAPNKREGASSEQTSETIKRRPDRKMIRSIDRWLLPEPGNRKPETGFS